MPSEITHKSSFRPARYLGYLLVATFLGWLMGINGVGMEPGAAPVDELTQPCPADHAEVQ